MKLRSIPLSIRFEESSTPNTVADDVQVLRAGDFFYQGRECPITSDMLKQMVLNFNEKVREIDLAVDYKHDSDDIAAGWFKSLYTKNNDTELWAKIEWTPSGRKILSDKEFRYISADFVLDYVNNETNKSYGPTLFGAGLTNRPFIKDMTPVVQLSEQKGTQTMDDKDKQIAALQAQIEELKKQIEADKKEEEGEGDMSMADARKKMEELMAENAKLKAAAMKYEEEKQMSEKKASFDKLLSEGKVCEAQREHYIKGDMIKFSEAYVKPGTESKGHSGSAPAPSNREEAQKQVMTFAEEMVKKGEAKTIGEAQYQVLKKHPELNKQIYG